MGVRKVENTQPPNAQHPGKGNDHTVSTRDMTQRTLRVLPGGLPLRAREDIRGENISLYPDKGQPSSVHSIAIITRFVGCYFAFLMFLEESKLFNFYGVLFINIFF